MELRHKSFLSLLCCFQELRSEMELRHQFFPFHSFALLYYCCLNSLTPPESPPRISSKNLLQKPPLYYCCLNSLTPFHSLTPPGFSFKNPLNSLIFRYKRSVKYLKYLLTYTYYFNNNTYFCTKFKKRIRGSLLK